MKRFETVFPACGSSNSAIEFTCDELYRYSNAIGWIDVCKLPEQQVVLYMKQIRKRVENETGKK